MRNANVGVGGYGRVAVPHLRRVLARNRKVMERVCERLIESVRGGGSLFVFGSGHSALFPLELYHRAGGASFVVPIVADYLLPTAGPPVVRVLERTPGAALPLLARAAPQAGEMVWLASQSGINGAVIDVALECARRRLPTVAFTSVAHSRSVASRHPSGKRLFELCDETVDLGGLPGDAAVHLGRGLPRGGPLSTLGSVFLGHGILVAACSRLEAAGHRCVYTSVNTRDGEARNRGLERKAAKRDPLLR